MSNGRTASHESANPLFITSLTTWDYQHGAPTSIISARHGLATTALITGALLGCAALCLSWGDVHPISIGDEHAGQDHVIMLGGCPEDEHGTGEDNVHKLDLLPPWFNNWYNSTVCWSDYLYNHDREEQAVIPHWHRFALTNDATVAVCAAIRDSSDYWALEHGLPDGEMLATDLTAVLYMESRLQHFRETSDGKVRIKRGDNGRAVGIGQLWPCWEKHFQHDRASVYWNIWMACGVLMYYGWPEDRMNAIGHYNGGQKSIASYARDVDKIVDDIYGVQPE